MSWVKHGMQSKYMTEHSKASNISIQG